MIWMTLAAMGDPSERVPLQEIRELLQFGQPLPFAVMDSSGRLLLSAGYVLNDEAQFASLVDRDAWVDRPSVDAERAINASRRCVSPALPSLFDEWERLLWQLDKLTRALARGKARGSEVSGLFTALQGLVDADPDVALFRCVRQDDRRFALYPLTHAMNCTVLAILAGRQLGWKDALIEALGCSALTMNLSILELQANMAEQGDPPSAVQFKQIRAHPEASAALLRQSGVTDPEWLATVSTHHEQAGGAGYPRGLSEVNELSQVLRAIDVFMAKISPRDKRPAMAPQTAVRQLFQQGPADPLAIAVIKTLGVHPPGSLLQLRSGEVAVAIRRPLSGPHPLVATLSDRQGRPVTETHRRDTAQAEFSVVRPLVDTPNFPRVVAERVYGIITRPAP
jgi:hypothetical protein